MLTCQLPKFPSRGFPSKATSDNCSPFLLFFCRSVAILIEGVMTMPVNCTSGASTSSSSKSSPRLSSRSGSITGRRVLLNTGCSVITAYLSMASLTASSGKCRPGKLFSPSGANDDEEAGNAQITASNNAMSSSPPQADARAIPIGLSSSQMIIAADNPTC